MSPDHNWPRPLEFSMVFSKCCGSVTFWSGSGSGSDSASGSGYCYFGHWPSRWIRTSGSATRFFSIYSKFTQLLSEIRGPTWSHILIRQEPEDAAGVEKTAHAYSGESSCAVQQQLNSSHSKGARPKTGSSRKMRWGRPLKIILPALPEFLHRTECVRCENLSNNFARAGSGSQNYSMELSVFDVKNFPTILAALAARITQWNLYHRERI